jgi:hypothetical protein
MVTAGLVARWINAGLAGILPDYAAVDPATGKGALFPFAPVTSWEQIPATDRERLTEVAYDVLCLLKDTGALVEGKVQQLPEVHRDWAGRRLGTPTAKPGGAPRCVCGKPDTLGVVHRLDGACYTPVTADEFNALTERLAALETVAEVSERTAFSADSVEQ